MFQRNSSAEKAAYDLLEISQNASLDQIKKSFKKLALKFHPDKNSAPDATEKFQALNNAYELLNNLKQNPKPFDSLNFDLSSEDFDPWFHTTNSTILPLLLKTNWQLNSPIEILKQTGAAAFNKELIINREWVTTGKTKEHFDKLLNQPFFCSDEMNAIIKHALNPDFLITKQDLIKHAKKINATIQIYYLILCIGKYIHPDLKLIENLNAQEQNDLYDAIYTHFSTEKLIEKITANKINIVDAYHNGTPTELAAIEELLTLPKKSIVLSGIANKAKQVELAETKIFSQTPIDYTNKNYYKYPQDLFYYFNKNTSGYRINDILEKFARNEIGGHFFSPLIDDIKQITDELNSYYLDLSSVLANIPDQPTIDVTSDFIKNPFIITLVKENLLSVAVDTLGENIQFIAVNEQKDKLALEEFFRENNLAIDVILTSELSYACAMKKRPKTSTDQNSPSSPSEEKSSSPSTVKHRSAFFAYTAKIIFNIKINSDRKSIEVETEYHKTNEYPKHKRVKLFNRDCAKAELHTDVENYLLNILKEIEKENAANSWMFSEFNLQVNEPNFSMKQEEIGVSLDSIKDAIHKYANYYEVTERSNCQIS